LPIVLFCDGLVLVPSKARFSSNATHATYVTNARKYEINATDAVDGQDASVKVNCFAHVGCVALD